MANQDKKSQVSSLEQLLKDSPNFALFMYEKVPHLALEGLRRELRKNAAKIKIVKNTLFRKALRHLGAEDKNIAEIDKHISKLVGNSGLLSLGEEWNAGLSAFHTFTDKEKGLAFKFGVLDKELYHREDLEKIAQLPAKPVLMAQLIGTMKSPVGHLAYAMKFNMQKLAYILNTKAQSSN